MANQANQNFENHSQPVGHMYVVIVVLVAGLAISGFGFYKHMGAGHAGLGALIFGPYLLMAIAVVLTLVRARFYSLCVQDRIIRLEMNVRLDKLISGAARERAKDLELGQLISLRFASDGELPALVEKVLNDKITDRKAIKRLIKNWQADFQRV